MKLKICSDVLPGILARQGQDLLQRSPALDAAAAAWGLLWRSSGCMESALLDSVSASIHPSVLLVTLYSSCGTHCASAPSLMMLRERTKPPRGRRLSFSKLPDMFAQIIKCDSHLLITLSRRRLLLATDMFLPSRVYSDACLFERQNCVFVNRDFGIPTVSIPGFGIDPIPGSRDPEIGIPSNHVTELVCTVSVYLRNDRPIFSL